jgi:hypothetical protein
MRTGHLTNKCLQNYCYSRLFGVCVQPNSIFTTALLYSYPVWFCVITYLKHFQDTVCLNVLSHTDEIYVRDPLKTPINKIYLCTLAALVANSGKLFCLYNYAASSKVLDDTNWIILTSTNTNETYTYFRSYTQFTCDKQMFWNHRTLFVRIDCRVGKQLPSFVIFGTENPAEIMLYSM